MIGQEDNIMLAKTVFDDNNQERKSGIWFGNPVPDLCLSFSPNFL